MVAEVKKWNERRSDEKRRMFGEVVNGERVNGESDLEE